MRLNDLRDLPGATTSKKRVGRGLGSGLGKTSGHGQKGQKSRSGIAIKGFEGGQMPLHRRLPKRGFSNIFAKDYNEVNVGRIQAAIDDKKLDASKPVTVEALVNAGVVRRARDGVRLLGKGELKAKVSFEVTGASSGAVKAVEAAGGTVTLTPMPQRTAKPEGEAAPKKAAKKAAKAAAKSTAKKPAAKKSAPKKAATKKSAAQKDASD
ncbi:50S ribosomal protein L15 [Methyloceanibacter methanicus]|uniref:Large ribosomal subunit protein uL15 n=1 Tax=Methyloceanibacter methanicus TaxID=1774968 RepID=A0A1E3VYW6_9HYPH|nr:50S ribosomal protein L15 [Methyloceanibacter methanicus]ODR98722.1 50S ribosomal protein L15 [Methyloceanibacter methanicus]